MSRYAEAHANATGAGDARPTALQIVQDADMQGKLDGKYAVVTGASSGIGVETARALAATGVKLFFPGRSPDKVKAALGESFDPSSMETIYMDQTSLASVREAAREILSKTDSVTLLVNNAGIMGVPERQLTVDGYEMQFATNHLSHFLLFSLLKPALLAGSTPEFNSRVVAVSSDAGQLPGAMNKTGNYNYENGDYHPWMAYGQSKLSNIYMANEIDRRYGSKGIHATSVHPGVIATSLARFLTEDQTQGIIDDPKLKRFWKSSEQGAATTVWAAVGKEWEGRGGRYLAHCAEAPPRKSGVEDPSGVGYAEGTYNRDVEGRLWTDSLEMVKEYL